MNGIYIHIPFCLKKCAYCDFASYTNSYSLAKDYIDAVISEMAEYKGEKADTVYIGGGTPTSLPPDLLLKLIDGANKIFNISQNAEITVECNPKTADYHYFKSLKTGGVNRLSIGLQSLIDSELKFLGRIHSAKDAIFCVESAKEAGFDNINLDYMFGLSCQTKESVMESLEKIISLSPAHLSCYSLIIEENTPFGKLAKNGEILQMDEDLDREIYKEIICVLKKNGYEHYEISNFAKEGKFSRHNTKYWKRQPYIGLGAAAHSFYDGKRFSNPETIDQYIDFTKNGFFAEKETLSLEDEISEFMFLGLRLLRGISLTEFKNYFKCNLYDIYKTEIPELISLGLLEQNGDYLRLTMRGIDVSNEVFTHFLI